MVERRSTTGAGRGRLHRCTYRAVVQEHIEALQALLYDARGGGRVDGGALHMHDRGLAVQRPEEVA